MLLSLPVNLQLHSQYCLYVWSVLLSITVIQLFIKCSRSVFDFSHLYSNFQEHCYGDRTCLQNDVLQCPWTSSTLCCTVSWTSARVGSNNIHLVLRRKPGLIHCTNVKQPVTLLASCCRRYKHIFTSYRNPGFLKSNWGGINSVDSQLVYHGEDTRPTAAVFIKGMWYRIVLGFVTRDLVALQIKTRESGDQKEAVVCSAYFPLDSGTPSPHKEFKELVK